MKKIIKYLLAIVISYSIISCTSLLNITQTTSNDYLNDSIYQNIKYELSNFKISKNELLVNFQIDNGIISEYTWRGDTIITYKNYLYSDFIYIVGEKYKSKTDYNLKEIDDSSIDKLDASIWLGNYQLAQMNTKFYLCLTYPGNDCFFFFNKIYLSSDDDNTECIFDSEKGVRSCSIKLGEGFIYNRQLPWIFRGDEIKIRFLSDSGHYKYYDRIITKEEVYRLKQMLDFCMDLYDLESHTYANLFKNINIDNFK